MKHLAVTDQTPFPIHPNQIDTSTHFFEAFDHIETEVSARYIVRLCQERGGWLPFTKDDIEAFYRRNTKHRGFTFNRLVEPEMVPPNLARAFAGYVDPLVAKGGGWIIIKDGSYHVTDDFIKRCFFSSPAKQPAHDAA